MNIYVGNLSYQTTENQLRNLFSEFGETKSASIVMDKFTNRSRGFGFVEMPNDAEAQKAIDKLHNSSLNLQTIKVNEAKPRSSERTSGGFERRY